MLKISTMSVSPQATATGDLAKTPFGHVLLYILERQLTGTLLLWRSDADTTPHMQLYAYQGRLLAGRFDSGGRELLLALIPLCSRTAGRFAFHADTDIVGRGPGVLVGPLEPVRVIAASLRGPVRNDIIDTVVDGIGTGCMQLKQEVDLEAFGLTDVELRVVQLLTGAPLSVTELCRQARIPSAVTRRLIYLLRVCKAVAVLPASHRAVSGDLQLPPPPPLEASGTSGSRWLNVSLPPIRRKSG